MQYAASFRQLAGRRHAGLVELGAVVALYAIYELARGFGDATLEAARANTARIVDLERSFGLFFESAVQDWAAGVPSLPTLLGLAYVTLHLGATGAAMVWLHRSHPARFATVRNVLVIATALSLVFYVLYPAAPPRLSGLGFADTVSSHTHVNLSSDLLGSLYNPFAAVPSMHFGYALLIGIVVATTARRPLVRLLGALYPPFMLFDIVATGNHFLFDAAMGALVVAAAWILANGLARDRTQPVRLAAHAYA
jgi:PAP2 superfamily